MKTIVNLGPSGWVTDMGRQLDIMIADAIVADASQSNIFTGVTSIPDIIQQHHGNSDIMCDELESKLARYLERCFDTAKINCDAIDEPNDSSRYQINMSIEVTRGTETINLSRALSIQDGAIADVLAQIGDQNNAYYG